MSKKIRSIFTLLALIVSVFTLNAQPEAKRESIPLSFTIYKTTNTHLTVEDVLKKVSLFKPPSTFTQKTHTKDIYWIKVDFSKELTNLEKDSIWYLNFGTFIKSSLYYKNNSNFNELKFGAFSDLYKNHSMLSKPGIPFAANTLIDNQFLILKVQSLTVHGNIQSWKVSYNSKFQNDLKTNFHTNTYLKTLIPYYVFSGICLVMFILTFAFFLYSRRKEFLFYMLFVLSLFLFLEVRPFNLQNLFFDGHSLLSYIFFNTLQVVINLFYIYFIIFYLDTKKVYPKLHIALKIITIILSLIIVLDVLFLIFGFFEAHIFILNIMRLIMTLFGVIGMTYLLIKSKNKISYFVVFGSFSYMAGALLTLFLNYKLYMITGSSLEILIFGIGLTYKIQQEYNEKLRFQKEAFANKTKALRAQINPHFIFNSLSSIQHLITSNDKVSALKYLSKFSNLTRNILEGSIETKVLLADEIKMLNDYLELESLRFEDTFSFQINVDDDLNPNAIEVPALIVQPFVENAILHGLLNKEGNDKKLTISYKEEANFIICEVDDNGIGRQATSKKESIHKSRGVEVTEKRLKILNELDDNTEYIKTIDKYDNSGNPTGTRVIIRIAIEEN